MLQSDIETLRAAQEALRDGKPLAALQQLDKKPATHHLARDREGLRAIALCQANQVEAARKATQSFLRRHATSALAPRVSSACSQFLPNREVAR
ncbi:MAG: hypothetical protein ACOY0T_19015 [Myxococcota bacterium]